MHLRMISFTTFEFSRKSPRGLLFLDFSRDSISTSSAFRLDYLSGFNVIQAKLTPSPLSIELPSLQYRSHVYLLGTSRKRMNIVAQPTLSAPHQVTRYSRTQHLATDRTLIPFYIPKNQNCRIPLTVSPTHTW